MDIDLSIVAELINEGLLKNKLYNRTCSGNVSPIAGFKCSCLKCHKIGYPSPDLDDNGNIEYNLGYIPVELE